MAHQNEIRMTTQLTQTQNQDKNESRVLDQCARADEPVDLHLCAPFEMIVYLQATISTSTQKTTTVAMTYLAFFARELMCDYVDVLGRKFKQWLALQLGILATTK